MARLPNLFKKCLRAGIDRKIAHINGLFAFQIHDQQFSAVIVERETQCRIAIPRFHGDKMSILAMESPAKCVA